VDDGLQLSVVVPQGVEATFGIADRPPHSRACYSLMRSAIFQQIAYSRYPVDSEGERSADETHPDCTENLVRRSLEPQWTCARRCSAETLMLARSAVLTAGAEQLTLTKRAIVSNSDHRVIGVIYRNMHPDWEATLRRQCRLINLRSL